MKIVHINYSNFGGASNACKNLHNALLNKGIDSNLILVDSKNMLHNIWHILKKKFDKFFLKDGELFSNIPFRSKLINNEIIKKADIIHLHWISNGIDYKIFFRDNKNKKIVWTLHDINSLTGGCHILNNCKNYLYECGFCPKLKYNNANDISHKNFCTKREAYSQNNIFFVCPSKSFLDIAKKSPLIDKICYIPHGRSSSFIKLDKIMCRKNLNLPVDKKILIFSSLYYSKNKGFHILKKALKSLNLNNILLVVIGFKYNLRGIPSLYLGNISDVNRLSEIYSAADVCVIPSFEESFSLTCQESMACGTPVIGTDTGAMSDMIIPLKTGLFVKKNDHFDLANKIKYILSKDNDLMGSKAYEHIRLNFSMDKQIDKYIRLYKDVLQKN